MRLKSLWRKDLLIVVNYRIITNNINDVFEMKSQSNVIQLSKKFGSLVCFYHDLNERIILFDVISNSEWNYLLFNAEKQLNYIMLHNTAYYLLTEGHWNIIQLHFFIRVKCHLPKNLSCYLYLRFKLNSQ